MHRTARSRLTYRQEDDGIHPSPAHLLAPSMTLEPAGNVASVPQVSQSRPEQVARLSLASSQLLVGTSVVAASFIVDAFPVMLGLAIRQSIATIALLVIVQSIGWRMPRLTRRDHLVIFLQALLGVVLFNLLLMLGVERTTAAASGIITSTVPAAITILAFLLGERISRLTALGVALAMMGVLVVNLAGAEGSEHVASAPLLGGLLVGGAVVCEAWFTILGKHVGGKIDTLQNCLLVCLYGTAILMPMGVWQLRGFDLSSVPPSGWLAIGWSAGPVMIGAFFLWFNGLRVIPASSAAVYTGLIPASALACAYLLLHERVQWQHLADMAMVMLAVVLVARPARKPTFPPNLQATLPDQRSKNDRHHENDDEDREKNGADLHHRQT